MTGYHNLETDISQLISDTIAQHPAITATIATSATRHWGDSVFFSQLLFVLGYIFENKGLLLSKNHKAQ